MKSLYGVISSGKFSKLNIGLHRAMYLEREYDFMADLGMQALLKASQPISILDVDKMVARAYGLSIFIYKLVIICPNVFQIFIAPHVVQDHSYYPSEAIARDWQSHFPSAHQLPSDCVDHFSNSSSQSDIFTGVTIISQPNRFSFCIKHHRDADNYWHWTFDWLPRLLALRKLIDSSDYPLSHEQIDFYSFRPLKKFQEEWFSLIFPDTLKVNYFQDPVQFYNHISCNHTFTTHHNIELITELRRLILSDCSQDAKSIQSRDLYGSRIYISRGQAKNGRNIVNEDELTSRLEAMGFTSLEMDSFSVHEQALIFNSAEFIIGAHGSAFVNMIFCKPFTQVIELFGPGYTSMHDYMLAHQCQLKWDYILGQSDESAGFASNYYIPVQKVVDMVA